MLGGISDRPALNAPRTGGAHHYRGAIASLFIELATSNRGEISTPDYSHLGYVGDVQGRFLRGWKSDLPKGCWPMLVDDKLKSAHVAAFDHQGKAPSSRWVVRHDIRSPRLSLCVHQGRRLAKRDDHC